MQERCVTRLLPDSPADADAFGSHERVADSIVEVVQTESGGKAIGLEGGWGAGKSTIVQLISLKLSQAKERAHKVAVFDMWSHQGDPLRRTFLENLIKQVQEFGWVDREQWDRRIDELAKRRREETTRVVPRLTPEGAKFALSLLAVPIGAALLGAGLSLWGSKEVSGPVRAVLIGLGLALALAPAICYGYLGVVGSWVRRRKGRTSEEGGWLSELPALVTGQASTESRTVVSQSPDPTSVEFESVFRDLLDDALEAEDRKLLIVVDNLDRVEPSDALSIWSTLQTFLGHKEYQRPDWIDRLWILIPYDDKAILRLWDGSGPSANSKLATSFLDKTFQLRFRVPPLLLSNWREFLKEALQQAFPDHPEEDYHGVFRAFATKGGPDTSAPTPRDLKTLVNQVGALHREWQDEFPLSHLACYVLFQRDCEDVRKALLSNEDIDLLSRIIGHDWRGIIAALHFGKPVEVARQLLLRIPIQTALAEGDGKALSELESIHGAGFWSVLEDTVPAGASDWDSLAPADLAKSAAALADSQLFDRSHSQPESEALRATIRAAAVAVEAWAPFDAETAQGMARVGHLVGNPEEVFPALLAGASNARVGPSTGERQEGGVSPEVWMSSAFTLVEGLVQLGSGEHLEQGLEVPLSAEQWVEVSHEVMEKDPSGRLLQYFELRAVQEIDEQLTQQIANNQLDENTFNPVYAAMATRSGNAMNSVAGQVSSRLQSGESFPGDQFVPLVKTLRVARQAGLISQDDFAGFAERGHYLHHLYQAVSENHMEAVSECMFGFLQAIPDGREPSHIGNSGAGYQYLNELLQDPDRVPGSAERFASLAKGTQSLPAVFKMTSEDGTIPPFVVKVLHTLLTSNDVPKPPDLVSENWAVIREVLGEGEESSESFEAFLKDLPGIDNLVAGILGETFDVQDSALYLALLRSSTSTDFVAWCVDGLSSVSRDAWSEALTSQGDLLDLVMELKGRGVNMVLGTTYYDALLDYAEQVSDGSVSAITNESWSDLFTLLDADHRELFHRRAYEILKNSGGEASEEFFALFGDILSGASILASDQRFIDQVCRPILEADNESGIAWMAGLAEADASLFTSNIDPAAAGDFKDRIRQRIDDTEEDEPTLADLKRIGAILGIEPEDPESESDARSEDMPSASE
ncbi:MAG: P-loop NTPase fold protein [Chloroflexota bacterium]|nr:P-loop NTPase fold protein [Chloroflexota bacterium]